MKHNISDLTPFSYTIKVKKSKICKYIHKYMHSNHGRENIGRQRVKQLMLISKSVEDE